jgi:outer membrane lipase/esterase
MRMKLSLAILILSSTLSLSASTFSSLVIFGDSLSDTGNLYNETGGIGPGPLQDYATGVVTDGPNTTPASAISGLWDQQLAQVLGVPSPVASTSGGTNYAYAGAETGSGFAPLTLQGVTLPVPNLNTQVASFLAANGATASASNLYVIWGGSNDIINNAGAYAAAPTPGNLLTLESTPATLIAAQVGNIQTLYAAGAKEFLFFDVPNLGATPEALALPSAEQSTLTGLSAVTEQDFESAVAQLRASDPGITIIPVDAFAGDLAVETSVAELGANNPYGLTNITTAAQGLADVNPDQYLYWDSLHPTTKGQEIIADLAEDSILANTPEPSTWVVAGSGLLLVLAAAKRRRKS